MHRASITWAREQKSAVLDHGRDAVHRDGGPQAERQPRCDFRTCTVMCKENGGGVDLPDDAFENRNPNFARVVVRAYPIEQKNSIRAMRDEMLSYIIVSGRYGGRY